ncbi:hypothetical protein JY651_47465 [Pyxidicoccus parkwayensis]|uniref:Glutathionylspermidine synthase pre-ATP-grasp-like domain-containing protein n=1 Tax=Pyxidicoccus parkwayensis TaxID=2813578 RepID=A0ABX7NUW2_9BACT|nr:hypothetical protein [Pyxidicoccus parkwaysis]QSQ22664.1 hypothetical protein JY651_47465 [Pyxidicoccus parkwaysis]
MDPVLHPLIVDSGVDSRAVLDGFRERLAHMAWAHETPDTLMAPVWSAASSVAHFEKRLVALYRAHCKVLHALLMGDSRGGPWREYVKLQRVVAARSLDWPVLGEDAALEPEMLLTERATRFLFGRPDIVLGPDGPKVVETNFDTAVGGQERPDGMWTMAAELFSPPSEYLATGRPLAGMRDYFAEWAEGAPCQVHWIMKNDETVRRELAPLLATLNDNPHRVEHLIHYAGDALAPLRTDVPSWLHRACSIYSVNRDRERFTALLEHLAPVVKGCTVPVVLSLLESKLFLAWLSDKAARPATLTAEEHEAVDTLLPWTRVLTLLDGSERERVRRNRGDFILKKTDSHQARDVFFGCNLSEEEWSSLLEARGREPAELNGASNIWVLQERVRPREFNLLEYTDAGPVERRTGLSCCPYLMGGRLRGLETWVTPATPNLKMIRHMQFVAHFIRRSM